MPPPLSATEVAWMMLGVTQGVLALAWAAGAWRVPGQRAATLGWAAWAALSAATCALFLLALRAGPAAAAWLHAAGGTFAVLALLALQRGVASFVARSPSWQAAAGALALALLAAALGLDPGTAALGIALHSALLAAVCLVIARDLQCHAREALHWRWPWLLALAPVGGAIGFAARALLAAAPAASVGAQAAGLGLAAGHLVLALALHATLAGLVVLRLAAELRHRARHDALTGLLNRRALDEALAAQLQRSLRNGEPFAVMVVDIDHLESINERHGHAVGDAALVHLARLLGEGTRSIDRVARYRHQAFVVLLPEVVLADARRLAERLRERVGASALAHGSGMLAFTVSIGVAEWWPRDDAERLLARADDALRRAKQGGRDRVEVTRAAVVARVEA